MLKWSFFKFFRDKGFIRENGLFILKSELFFFFFLIVERREILEISLLEVYVIIRKIMWVKLFLE